MKKTLLLILIFLGALTLHAQEHQKITIDVEMDSVTFTQPTLLDTITCTGNLTLTLGPAIGGGGGTITYQWQQSTDNVTWVNVPNTGTGQNYVISGLTANTYYRRLAIACRTITGNSALVTFTRPPLPIFMDYNLGADPALNTPALQMAYLANNANGATATTTNYGRVFGGRYQWGRQNLPYAINPNTYLLYDGSGTANHTVAWASSMVPDGNGQLPPGQDDYHVYNTSANKYDWSAPQNNALWGNGQAITYDFTSNGVLHTDGKYYQKPVKTINDPCPPGWRVPTQNDWELMCNYDCDPTSEGEGSAILFLNSSVGKATSGLTWVQVQCSGSTCKMGTLASNSRGGYAVYRTSEWESAGYTAADNLITATPQPLLFLPGAGIRASYGGTVSFMGTGYYWSSSIRGTNAYALDFGNSQVTPYSPYNRAYGISVRCVKCGVGEDCYVAP